MLHPAVRLALRQLSRELIWHVLNRHSPAGKRDIALFGSRRSGTTLLMEVIAANKGVKFSNQPFSIYSASGYQLRWLPIYPDGQPFAMPDEDQQKLRSYVAAICDGRLHINEPWRFWRSDFDFRSDRMVLKITNGHGIAEWLNSQFNLHTIVLVRHPIPQSLSIIHNNWGVAARGFLSNDAYRQQYLTAPQIALAADLLRQGTLLEKHVVGWCLENLPLLRAYPQHGDWCFLTYEDFVLHADEIIHEWSRAFDLPDIARMLGAAGRPSLSTAGVSDKEGQSAVASADQQAMLSRWRRKVDDETEKAAMSILEAFEIDVYQYGSPLPSTGWRPCPVAA